MLIENRFSVAQTLVEVRVPQPTTQDLARRRWVGVHEMYFENVCRIRFVSFPTLWRKKKNMTVSVIITIIKECGRIKSVEFAIKSLKMKSECVLTNLQAVN